MIKRKALQIVLERLKQFPAVVLLGPRQVGKTTLAKEITNHQQNCIYLDLESRKDQAKLSAPLSFLSAHENKLIILDEIQFMPELFQELRGLIDQGRDKGLRTGRFLLLGSAQGDLLKQSSESLAGRVAYIELRSLSVQELQPQQHQHLWIRGGFPDSFLANSDTESAIWRENFIKTYLERNIPQIGPKIPSETLRRFWTMLAHTQGQLLNSAQLARSLAVDGKTIARYLDLMVDLLLVRRLPPYQINISKRLVRSPKTYIRDSGLVHTLLTLDDEDAILSHPIAGESWEGFIIENILCSVPERTSASFYRTATGAEIDLILEIPKQGLWAIEIKRSSAPKLERGFFQAYKDLNPDRCFVIYLGDERYSKTKEIEVISLNEFCNNVL